VVGGACLVVCVVVPMWRAQIRVYDVLCHALSFVMCACLPSSPPRAPSSPRPGVSACPRACAAYSSMHDTRHNKQQNHFLFQKQL
jgi:hypothetical protein